MNRKPAKQKDIEARGGLTGERHQAAKSALEEDQGRGDALVPLANSYPQAWLEGQFMLRMLRAQAAGDFSDIGGFIVDWVTPKSDRMTIHVNDQVVKPMIHSLVSATASPTPMVKVNSRGGLTLVHPGDEQPAIHVSTGSRKDWTRAFHEASCRPPLSALPQPVRLNPVLVRPGEDAEYAALLLGSGLLRSAGTLRDDLVARTALTFVPVTAGGAVEWLGAELPPKLAWIRARTALWGVVDLLPPPSASGGGTPPDVTTGPGGPADPWQPTAGVPEIDIVTGIAWTQLREAGEEIWFETLVRHFEPKLTAAASRMSGCQTHDARDLAADTLMKAWGRRAFIRDNPAPWLYTTLRYNVYNRYRTHLRRPTDYIELDTVQATQADIADLVAGRAVLDQAMAMLSHEDRLLMLAYYFDKVSYAELAECYGISIPTARKRTERVLRRLRHIIDKLGGFA